MSENSDKSVSLESFVSNASNRKRAEEQAVSLYAILSKGGKIEDADELSFTTKECVRKTNLSYSKLRQLLELFSVFGLVTLENNTTFHFNFDEEKKRQTILIDVMSMVSLISSDITRYRNAVECDSKLSDEEKSKLLSEMKSKVLETIQF